MFVHKSSAFNSKQFSAEQPTRFQQKAEQPQCCTHTAMSSAIRNAVTFKSFDFFSHFLTLESDADQWKTKRIRQNLKRQTH